MANQGRSARERGKPGQRGVEPVTCSLLCSRSRRCRLLCFLRLFFCRGLGGGLAAIFRRGLGIREDGRLVEAQILIDRASNLRPRVVDSMPHVVDSMLQLSDGNSQVLRNQALPRLASRLASSSALPTGVLSCSRLAFCAWRRRWLLSLYLYECFPIVPMLVDKKRRGFSFCTGGRKKTPVQVYLPIAFLQTEKKIHELSKNQKQAYKHQIYIYMQ